MLFKVCGMRCQEDLDLAAQTGFSMAGFIFCEKSPRHVDPEIVRTLRTRSMLRVGVLASKDAGYIADCAQKAGVDLVQLHGNQDVATMQELGRRLGGESLIRVLWPASYKDVTDLQRDMELFAPHCAAFLLDAGQSGGGHGISLSLDFVGRVVFPRPWLLAGGLNAQSLDRVARLPAHLRPKGLDFNSRLERAPGKKDARLMKEVIARAQELHLGPDGAEGLFRKSG